ncbi:MAG: rod shape-determining protein MreD [Phycisphaerae bacterium]
MRWLTFALFTACALVLQSAVAPRIELLTCRPDWLVIIVVFFALHARNTDAVVGAWIIGAGADLMTIEQPGFIALSYSLAALAVASVRDYFFRQRILTQSLIAGATCLMVQTAWFIYRRARYDYHQSFLADFALTVLLASVYTTLWAPALHRLMLAMSSAFGIRRPRYLHSGLLQLDKSRV